MEVRADLTVGHHPQVYPPSEDTFLLIRALEVRPGQRALEVGTGPGLVALHMASRTPTVATDINPHALALARDAARRHGLPVETVRTPLVDGLRGPFDVVAFNPPYLPGEAGRGWIDRAWEGGPAGDAIALAFLADVPRVLAPGGVVYLVLSSLTGWAPGEVNRRFRVRRVLAEKFDFETLAVYELR